jgi:hypothetical protein
MNYTREEFEAAVATIPQSSLKEHNWLWRVNSWDKVNREGALQAAYLRRWSVYADMRSMAPEFYDWLLKVFPANQDQRVLNEHLARSRTFFGQA